MKKILSNVFFPSKKEEEKIILQVKMIVVCARLRKCFYILQYKSIIIKRLCSQLISIILSQN